jgi:hypothetical protein
MERLVFHVVLDHDRWSVRISLQDAPVFFDRLNDAMDNAIQSARTQWELRGRPTGVRLELPNGLCAEERTFGQLALR